MLDFLKKHGVPAGLAALIVLIATIGPMYRQYKLDKEQDARIAALEARIRTNEAK
jgi:hypothetical protein